MAEWRLLFIESCGSGGEKWYRNDLIETAIFVASPASVGGEEKEGGGSFIHLFVIVVNSYVNEDFCAVGSDTVVPAGRVSQPRRCGATIAPWRHNCYK